MRWNSAVKRGGGRGLGVVMLTLSLVHMPLPQPDFHNVRHHDKPGEVCEHHDHLLRWHPGATPCATTAESEAGADPEVAVLHWHWFLATADGSDPAPDGSGQAIHAQTPDWSAGSWNDGLQLTAGLGGRDASNDIRAAFRPLNPALAALALDGLLSPSAGPPCPVILPERVPLAPSVSLNALLQRWVC